MKILRLRKRCGLGPYLGGWLLCLLIPPFLFANDSETKSASGSPSHFAYVLQADRLASSREAATHTLADSERDWIILDPEFESLSPWAQTEIGKIRQGREGRKVIAYISIGEAEDYRAYWNPHWIKNGHITSDAPHFLQKENPHWKGNFIVKYWDSAWQKIVLRMIDSALEQGFDGVYLDIVDGFETFEKSGEEWIDHRQNPETSQTYRRDMVDWVKAISKHVRKRNPSALIIPQNGTQLLVEPRFLDAISAIGVEDLFFQGDRAQAAANTKDRLESLKPAQDANKPILLIEYPSKSRAKSRLRKLAADKNLILLLTDRQLKTLGDSIPAAKSR